MRPVFTLVCLFSIALFTNCKKNKDIFPPAAEIYGNKTEVGIGTATLQAGFSGYAITERGICWGTANDPKTNGPHVAAGSGEGNIVQVLTGLTPGTLFFARAYAINEAGTIYSPSIQFLVQKAPDMVTDAVLSRGTNSAAIHVRISFTQTEPLAKFGICYAKHPAPTTSDNTTTKIENPGTEFSQALTGLDAGTAYFARAFVELPEGTFFGNEISFNTYSGVVYDIDGNAYYTVKIGEQEWMASNLHTTRYQDGTPVPGANRGSWWNTPADAWGVYEDQESYAKIYGRYYNQDAVKSSHGLAPAGWKIPSLDDWKQLFKTVGEDSAAFRLISVQWSFSGADNRAGLTVMPTGMRNATGYEEYPMATANFWTSTIESFYHHSIVFGRTYVDYIQYSASERPGLSIRCIKQ